jgi:hypothetical protein
MEPGVTSPIPSYRNSDPFRSFARILPLPSGALQENDEDAGDHAGNCHAYHRNLIVIPMLSYVASKFVTQTLTGPHTSPRV